MDSLGCFGIRNSDKFILHFNQVCFQIYGMAPPYRRQRAEFQLKNYQKKKKMAKNHFSGVQNGFQSV